MKNTISSTNAVDYEFIFNDNGVNTDNLSILFNFEDDDIQHFPNLDKLKNYANRIVYNFPKASNIRIDDTNIYGTIIAPEANVILSNINILNTQIISKELTITNSNMDELVIFEGLFHDIDGDPITIDLIASYLRKTQLESNQSINILGEPFISNYSDDESKSESDSESDNENNVQEVDDGDDDVVEEVVEDNYDDGDNIDENPIPDNLDGSICKTDDDPLGIISNFGAFSFGDFIAYNSDVQGRIAAKNLVDVSSYAINQEVYGSKRYKCNESPLKNDFQFAVVAGTVKIVNSGLSNGGIAYSNNVDQTDESLKENIINNGCSIINDSSIVNFDAVEKQMNTLSQNISKLEDNGAVRYILFYKDHNIYI